MEKEKAIELLNIYGRAWVNQDPGFDSYDFHARRNL